NQNAGVVGSDPFIFGTQSTTPLIAGLAGGAAPYGLVTDATQLSALTASSGLSSAIANAPANALIAVVRESIPASFPDEYTGYDLVLVQNLTSVNLPGPQLGIIQGSLDAQNSGDEMPLNYQFLGTPNPMDALPGGSLFALLVPSTDPAGGQFVNASLSGA